MDLLGPTGLGLKLEFFGGFRSEVLASGALQLWDFRV